MGWRKRDFLYLFGCIGALKVGADLAEDSQYKLSEGTSTPQGVERGRDPSIETSISNTDPVDPPQIDISITHQQSRPNQVKFFCNIEISDSIESLKLSVDEPIEQTEYQGFDKNRDEYDNPNLDDYVFYEWNGEQSVCSFEFVIDVSDRQSEDFDGRDYAGTEEWVFAPSPGLNVSWSDGQTDGIDLPTVLYPLANRQADHVQMNVNKPSYIGNNLIYIGDFEKDSYVGERQSFSLIVPAHADPPAHSDIFEMLDFSSQRLKVGEVTDKVVVFITTDPIRQGGVNHNQVLRNLKTQSEKSVNEFWVHESSQLMSPNSTVVHEYVHGRQNLQLDSEMEWFREASAEYYAARITYANGITVSKADVTDHLYPDRYGTEILAEKDEWSDPDVPYDKGGYILLVLDELIREYSDHERFLQSVFYDMNTANEVTYSDFVDFVSEAAGASLDNWCEKYIRGIDLPPIPEGWERDTISLD